MISFKYILLIGIILLSLSSCKNEPQLTGHWVSKEYFQNKPFKTIDFFSEKDHDLETGKERDSIVFYIQLNKNSLAYSISSGLAGDASPNRFYFAVMEHYFSTIEFRNDSIYVSSELNDKTFEGVFVKVKEPVVSQQELFLGSELEIELPECDGTYSPEEPKKAINLNIGYKNDSILVNFMDTYASNADLKATIHEGNDYIHGLFLPQSGNSIDLEVHLNCDRRVPYSFLSKIISTISATDTTLKIYKASFDSKNKKLCYKPIL